MSAESYTTDEVTLYTLGWIMVRSGLEAQSWTWTWVGWIHPRVGSGRGYYSFYIVVTFELFELYFWLELYELYFY